MASSDQQAGGLEGHISSRRSNSKSEAMPVGEAEVESRNEVAETDEHTQASQESPRRLMDAPSTTATPSTAGISRNPSPYSAESTQANPHASYFDHAYRTTPPPRSSRPPEPPVTKGTLSELDVTKIIHNPKLRHDINFDPELHFRPNLDGEKGRRKQEKANQFWTALTAQLMEFVMDRPGFYAKYGTGDDWSLPQLLKAVKEIIQTLVPLRDRLYLDEGLNIDLLMQQFNKGIADLEKLAMWLSQVLKSHCAPMRDEWVDEMYRQLSDGNRTNDMHELVKGMRSLLSVLEAMKLDVANHQIRCLRPVLIEDTVHFEQRFFLKKIQAGKLNMRMARDWYRRAEQRCTTSPTVGAQLFGETAVFFESLSRLMLPSTPESQVPNTFLFDEERVLKLRADVMDAINLELCMRLYEDLDRAYPRMSHSVPFFVSDQAQHAVDGNDSVLSLPAYLANNPAFTSSPAGSRPSSFISSSSTDSAHSSPRSSLCLPQSSAADLSEAKRRSRELYNSLVALLHTSSPSGSTRTRWQNLAPSLALQIFRNTAAPPEALPDFEAQVASVVCNLKHPRHREVEAHFHQKLVPELARRVRDFRGLSGVNLFSVATGGRIHGPGRTWDGSRASGSDLPERDGGMGQFEGAAREPRDEAGIEDMATRMAHLGVLHWRVWAQLVYVGNVDGDFPVEM